MRYIFLLAVLLALPETAAAQVGMRADRSGGSRSSTTSTATSAASQEERTAVPKGDRSRAQSENRTAERSGDRGRGRDGRASDNRQSDQPRNTTGLGPLGLPPVQKQQMPWWEQRQRQTPWWEQNRTPQWERQPQPAWEQQLVNPSRAAMELNRKARQADRLQRRHSQPTVILALPSYRYFYPGTTYGYGVESTTYITPAPPNVVAPPAPPEIDTGFLRLEVEPRSTLQVFVDGLYIGTLADLGDEFELRLGARRIELRAPGYRTLIFDTQIVPDRTIVYRGALEPLAAAPAPAPQAPQAPRSPEAIPARSTIYMIPGCYIGNVAPTTDMVRPGCDITKVITRAPQ